MYLDRVRSATPLQGCCLVTPRSSSQPWFFAVLPDDGAEQDAYLLQAPLDQLRCWESHMNWDYNTGATLYEWGFDNQKMQQHYARRRSSGSFCKGNRWLKRTTDQNVVPISCDVKSPSIVLGTQSPNRRENRREHVAITYHQWSGHRYHWAFQHQ